MSGGAFAWTEVRRRKTQECKRAVETTYFVSTVPDNTWKGELRRIFSSYGRLSDILTGQQKGKNDKNYAFIRFLDVVNTELEMRLVGKALNGMLLDVNLARYDRKEVPHNHPTGRKRDTGRVAWGQCIPNRRHRTGVIGTTNPSLRSQTRTNPDIKQPLEAMISSLLPLLPLFCVRT